MTGLQIVMAGASGFLGTHLTTQLTSRGHAVVALTRRPTSAPDESTWDPYAGVYDRDVIAGADVVINLAGTPTIGNPHSKRWARELRESRVTTTRVLAEAIADSGADAGVPRRQRHRLVRRPRPGGRHRGVREPRRQRCSPRSPGSGRPPPQPAVDAGARVCFLRTAPVMDRRAAPLKQLRLLTKLGLGGPSR